MTSRLPWFLRFAEKPLTALWSADLRHTPAPRRWLLQTARICAAVLRDIATGDMTLWAMSLVYTTLLALVPLLAISFSILKGFGVHNQLEPVLLDLLTPLGEKAAEVTERVIGFVDNARVGVLGAVGFAFLFYTAISLMQKVEQAFNKVWHAPRQRNFAQRVRDYLSVLVLGPTMLFAAVGVSATVMSSAAVESITVFEPVRAVLDAGGRLLPFAVGVVVLTFFYAFIPNTRVRLSAALVGGLTAGVLGHLAGRLFAMFVSGSANYTALYSTFATAVVLLIWLYVVWLVLLIGNSIAFYMQNPVYAGASPEETQINQRGKESLALAVAALIVRRFYLQLAPCTLDDLTGQLHQRPDVISRLLEALEQAGLIKSSSDMPPAYLPARPPEQVRATAVVDALRRDGQEPQLPEAEDLGHLDELLARGETAAEAALGDVTLKDLALPRGAPAAPEVTRLPSTGQRS